MGIQVGVKALANCLSTKTRYNYIQLFTYLAEVEYR